MTTEKIFRVTMLPAAQGDATWLTVGDTSGVHHILIDTGVIGTAPALAAHALALRTEFNQPVVISLMVLSHIDADHIAGAPLFLSLLRELGITVHALWYNGYHQVFGIKEKPADTLGAAIAEQVSAQARHLRIPINPGLAADVALTTASSHSLAPADLPGVSITVLGPDPARLRELKGAWSRNMRGTPGTEYEATYRRLESDKLGAGRTGTDTAPANGLSIVLLIEYAGTGLLMTGDAFASDLLAALAALPAGRRRLIRYVKLPHHGSARNICPELVEQLVARHYLVSTNGANGRHPDVGTIELIMARHPDATFHFNYESPQKKIAAAIDGVRVGSRPDSSGLTLNLSPGPK